LSSIRSRCRISSASSPRPTPASPASTRPLLATEGVTLKFAEEGIRRLAEIAFQVNEKTENIGARRLHTVMEKLLEDISFDAGKRDAEAIDIDRAYVDSRLGALAQDEDLSRYVL
jgi:ATP-dependent HslUV protease ATP-binding subunit HslU